MTKPELHEYEKLEGLLDRSFIPRLKRVVTVPLVITCCISGSFVATMGIRTYQLHQISNFDKSGDRYLVEDGSAVNGNQEIKRHYKYNSNGKNTNSISSQSKHNHTPKW
ncbi:MAG: hypothetical protein PUP93_20425 [Rhizonema sp. NSF051]|nr:hypothetical protein [Rhizonema sp. NSF051]